MFSVSREEFIPHSCLKKTELSSPLNICKEGSKLYGWKRTELAFGKRGWAAGKVGK